MQAWHKKEKAKQAKKGKAEKQKLRTEKLARRNPDRIQKQIDDLKAIEEGGRMSAGDRKQLAELERDLAAVKKAKEALGEKVTERRAGVKRSAGEMERRRRRDEKRPYQQQQQRVDPDESDSGESTSSSVRGIAMPSGTPPPLAKAWPRGPRAVHELPERPAPAPVQTTYAAAPILRDLRKEAAVFVPAAVKRKMLVEKATREEEGEEEEGGDGGSDRGEVEGEEGFARRKINAAPDVDVEFSKFRAEMEEVDDEEA